MKLCLSGWVQPTTDMSGIPLLQGIILTIGHQASFTATSAPAWVDSSIHRPCSRSWRSPCAPGCDMRATPLYPFLVPKNLEQTWTRVLRRCRTKLRNAMKAYRRSHFHLFFWLQQLHDCNFPAGPFQIAWPTGTAEAWFCRILMTFPMLVQG